MNPVSAETSKRRFMIALALIAILFMALIGLSAYTAMTHVSIEDKVCENQKFTLSQMDWINEQAQGLIVGSSRRTADETAFIIQQFQNRRNQIQSRLIELDKEYC
jgi:type II secretory pathway component PulJ